MISAVTSTHARTPISYAVCATHIESIPARNSHAGRCLRSAAAGWIIGAVLAMVPFMAHAQHRPSRGGNGKPVAMFITYTIEVKDRAAVREAMKATGAAQFEKWKSEGVFKEYLILFSSYSRINSNPWDMLVILDFARFADTDKWKEIDRVTPGGLPPKILGLATPGAQYFSEILSQRNLHDTTGDREKHVFDVAPYIFKSGPSAGIPFVHGYVRPQLDPFVDFKVISGYGCYLNINESQWSYLVILDYPDVMAFDDHNKAPAREKLVADPAWRALHEVKNVFRTEFPMAYFQPIVPKAK